jgi:hypothetical protein
MKAEYWILDHETPGENEGSVAATGPYDTLDKAKTAIREEARDTFMDADKSLRDVNDIPWDTPKTIVQRVVRISAEPKARVTVTLRESR